jgi:GDP-L-fucose synthase
VKIYVAGHRGLVGSAIVRTIEASGEHTWIGQSRQELDLLDRKAVFAYVAREKPDWVIVAAAKVGGIHANATYPVEFLSENLQIETNLIDASHSSDIERVLFLGSSCIYPRLCPQPIKEQYLLTGALESTNEAYALAKIAGLKLIQAYRTQHSRRWISVMPTNLYGPNDNFDTESSHVLPALIRKFDDAKLAGSKTVKLWGTGEPLREFLYVDDLANACLHLLSNYDGDVALNAGTGQELSIKALAGLVAKIIGFEGEIVWDSHKPDGTPRKVLDTSLLTEAGWAPTTSLQEGIQLTYDWYQQNNSKNE